MDYEKKYKEAFERMETHVKDGRFSQEFAALIFPELKESDDEKIRKEIKAFIKSRGSQITQSKTDGWLAWLKKQGEHAKFRDSIQVEDKVTRNQDGVLVNLSQLKRVAKPSDDIDTEKQVEQKQPKELTNSEFVEKCKGLSRLEQHILALVPTRPIDAIKVDARTIRYLVEQEQGEQKPTEWSEEDEDMLKSILATCKMYAETVPSSPGSHLLEMQEGWLKSLRPQKQQEWSKDDEIILEGIIGAVSNKKLLNKYQLEWLSHLRPQKQWKPTERMLEALKWAKCEFHPDCPKTMEQLQYLYTELKTLYYDRT